MHTIPQAGAPRQRISYHSAFGGAALYQREARSNSLSDTALTADTIGHMHTYVAEDATSAPVSAAADQVRALAAAEGSNTPADLAAALHSFMRAEVLYVDDAALARGLTDSPDDAEVLIRPADLFAMRRPQGDCDDFAMGMGAILTALRIPWAFKTTKSNPLNRGQWSHVYVVAQLAGGPLILDTSHGPYPGWEVSPIFKARLWPPMKNTLAGLRASGDFGGEFTPAGEVVPTYTPYTPAPDYSNSAPPINYGAIIGTAETAAARILGARYGVAQLNPGQYQRNADGSIMYQGAPGQALPSFAGISSGSSSTLLLLGVAAVVVVVIATSGHKG